MAAGAEQTYYNTHSHLRILRGGKHSSHQYKPFNFSRSISPNTIPTYSAAGRVAGVYIGTFILLPRMYTDTQTIASPYTTTSNKTDALLDLSIILGSMWAFTKFVAKKHPKTATAIMIATAGHHALKTTDKYIINPVCQKLAFGQTGQVLFFNTEEDYLNSRPSCTDGRKPVFLNNSQKLKKFLSIKNN